LLGLGVTYTVHLRLIGNQVVDFLFVLIVAFLSRPPLWRSGATYNVRLRLIRKLVVDFLLVLVEFFR